MKQPGDLDVSDYSFWSLGFHLAKAIEHDPELTLAHLTSRRKYSISTGLKEPVPPFEYLVAQNRYFATGETGEYLQRFKLNLDLATAAVDSILGVSRSICLHFGNANCKRRTPDGNPRIFTFGQ